MLYQRSGILAAEAVYLRLTMLPPTYILDGFTRHGILICLTVGEDASSL